MRIYIILKIKYMGVMPGKINLPNNLSYLRNQQVGLWEGKRFVLGHEINWWETETMAQSPELYYATMPL